MSDKPRQFATTVDELDANIRAIADACREAVLEALDLVAEKAAVLTHLSPLARPGDTAVLVEGGWFMVSGDFIRACRDKGLLQQLGDSLATELAELRKPV